MLRIPTRHIVAFVSLLLFLLTGQVSVHGYVWCLGEDGHAALEYAENNSCGSEAASAEQDCHDGEGALSDLDQDDHCGPCLDIPTSLEFTSSHHQYQKELSAPVGLPVSGQALPAVVSTQTLSNDLFAQPPPRVSQTLLSHRTVVLLN